MPLTRSPSYTRGIRPPLLESIPFYIDRELGKLEVGIQDADRVLVELDANYTSLDGRVTANASAITGILVSITDINGALTVIAAQWTELSASITDLEANYDALASAYTLLEARVTAAEDSLIIQASQITDLEARLTTGEGDIITLSSAFTLLEARITVNETYISSYATQITVLESTVIDLDSGITANASAITALTTDVTIIEGNVTANASDITSLNASVVSANGNIAANASASTALEVRVTVTENSISSQASSITALEVSLGASAALLPNPTFARNFEAWSDAKTPYADGGELVDDGVYYTVISGGLSGGKVARVKGDGPLYSRYPIGVDVNNNVYRIRLRFRVNTEDTTGSPVETVPVCQVIQYDTSEVEITPAIDLIDGTTAYTAADGWIYTTVDLTVADFDSDCRSIKMYFQGDDNSGSDARVDLDLLEIIDITEAYANASAIAALTVRVTDNEDGIVATASDVTALTATVVTNTSDIVATGTALTALDVRVTSNESGISVSSSDITALDSRLTTAEGSIVTNASATSTLDTRVTANEGGITANAGDITTLSATVVTLEGDTLTNSSAIDSLTTSVNNRNKVFFQAAEPTAYNLGDIWYDTDDDNHAYVWTGSTWDDAQDQTIVAQASSLSSLTTTVGDHTTTLDTYGTSINGIESKWGVAINANGTITGRIQMDGTGETSTVEVLATSFKVKNSTTGSIIPFEVVGGNVYINGQKLSAESVDTPAINPGAVSAPWLSKQASQQSMGLTQNSWQTITGVSISANVPSGDYIDVWLIAAGSTWTKDSDGFSTSWRVLKDGAGLSDLTFDYVFGINDMTTQSEGSTDFNASVIGRIVGDGSTHTYSVQVKLTAPSQTGAGSWQAPQNFYTRGTTLMLRRFSADP